MDGYTSNKTGSQEMLGTEVTTTPAMQYALATADDNASDPYYWIMIALLMVFVLAFLLVLKRARNVRLAGHSEKLSDLAEPDVFNTASMSNIEPNSEAANRHKNPA